MSNKYGTPVQVRETIQDLRVDLAAKVAAIIFTAQDDTLTEDAHTFFERLVSDVNNEMLSISVDKGLPFVSYAKVPAVRWDSNLRTSVSLKKFLKTRLGIDGQRRDNLIAAIIGGFAQKDAVTSDDDVCTYPA